MSKICDNKSVGALIWDKDHILLIERKNFPPGFAPPAGHVDDDFSSREEAVRGEVKEEVGLDVVSLEVVLEGRKNNECRREGGDYHEWTIYEVKTSGEVSPSKSETKHVDWHTRSQVQELGDRTKQYLNKKISEADWLENPGLEPVWYEWFKEYGLIK